MAVRIPSLEEFELRGNITTPPPAANRPAPSEPQKDTPIGPDRPVSLADLTPGRVVERWTDATDAGVWAPLPCHENQAVKVDHHRTAAESVAVCRPCGRSFSLALYADADGSHFAVFTVAVLPYLLSRTRRQR